tara:strand:+ start:7402 stop:9315 length:1914 start_codon:yes stop_codon:yes gene_type:complete
MPGKADRVSLTYEADIGPLIKKLKEVDDLTGAEVRKAVATLRKATKPLNKNASDAKRAGQMAAKGLKDLGDTAGDTESSLRAISGVLGMVSPEAEQALNAVAELGGGLEGVTRGSNLLGLSIGTMTAALGLLAIAAAGAAASYALYENNQQKAADASGRLTERLKEQQRLVDSARAAFGKAAGNLASFERSLQDADREIAVAIGEITDLESAFGRVSDTVDRQFHDAIRAGSLEVTAHKRALEGLAEQLSTVNERFHTQFERQAETKRIQGEVQKVTTALQAAEQRHSETLDRKDKALSKLITLENVRANQRKKAKESTDSLTGSINDETAAREALADAPTAEDQAAANKAAARMLQDLQAAGDKRLEQELAINRAFEDRQARIDELQAQGLSEEEAASLRFENNLQRMEDLDNLEQEHLARKEKREQAARERKQAGDKAVELAGEELRAKVDLQQQQRLMAQASLYGSLATAGQTAAMLIADSNKRAARVLWGIASALALAEIAANTAVAISAANALPPGVSTIKKVAIGISAATQTAAVLAATPSFNDTPGVMQLPSGGLPSFAPNDYVVAAKDLGDMRRQIDEATGGPAPVVEVIAIPSYEGRTYDRARRDAYRRPGPDFNAINAGRVRGQGGW